MIYLMLVDTPEEKRKFMILYEKYRYLVIRVALDVLRDRYLAEDAVHEAFIKVAKNMDKIGNVESLETKRYLVTIVKNAAIDIYRKRNKQMQREIFIDEIIDEIEGSGEAVTFTDPELDHEILEALYRFPDKYRDVFLLKYSHNKENSEIADLLGIPEGTVRQRIRIGKEILQLALEKKGGKAE